MQPFSGNQPLTSQQLWWTCSSSNVPRLPSFLEMLQNPHVLLTFDKVHNPLCLPRETTSEHQKVVRTCGAFKMLTSKCASRHNGMHMHALFRHLNFQKCSEPVSFLHSWLRNVLRATTACTFFDIWTSKRGPELVCFAHFDLEMCFVPQRTAFTFSTAKLPKVLRSWCVLYILTWECASRHNGVQLFISHLASWLRTRRFSEPTFRPFGTTNHWKNTVFCDFPTFSRTWIFLLGLSLSSSLLFSDSSHLCFSSVHTVGSLTSKLPSTNILRYITQH